MRKNLLFITALMLSLLIVACSNDSANEISSEEIKQKVNEYSVGNFTDLTASITSSELVVIENGKETNYKLPDDEFFVSIAPFIEQTHQ